MEMVALVKKIEELKELMVEANVSHINIDKYSQYDDDNDQIVNKFETDIHQDDHNKPFKCSRAYYGYARRH